MKPSRLQKFKRGAGRVTAIASGLALATGMSLVAISPAQASSGEYDESDVYASDINASTTDGWRTQGTGDATITSSGLGLTGTVGFIHDYSVDLGYTFANMVNDGQVSWTTSTGSVYFQVPVSFGTGLSTTLQSATASGTTTTASSDLWKTSAAIGSAYAAGDTAPLTDLVNAITAIDADAQVSGFGLVANGSASTVTGINWRGKTTPSTPRTVSRPER